MTDTPIPAYPYRPHRHGTAFRTRFPRLSGQPSPRAQSITAQSALRGEEPPEGRTAGEARADGYVVPICVPDDAVLEADTFGNAPPDVSSIGRPTGFVWRIAWSQYAAWFTARPEALWVMTPAELEGTLRAALRVSNPAEAESAHRVAALVEGEAYRREEALAREASDAPAR